MLIKGEKYACEACVRGHRVSNCQHSDRPLQHINKKGRPVSQCTHCRTLRKSRSAHVRCECGEKAHTKGACSHEDTAQADACCCSHGGRCSCSIKKEHLDPVLESDSDEAAPVCALTAETRRPRAHTEGGLTIFTNGHHKPVHKHNTMAHKCGLPYVVPRNNSLPSPSSGLANRSVDNLPHTSTIDALHSESHLKDSMESARKEQRMVKSEQGSPHISPTSTVNQQNGLLSPLEPTSFGTDYNFLQNMDSFTSLPDHDLPLFSAGLCTASIDWSHYDGLDFNNDDFAVSSYSQAASFNGFDFGGIEQPALTTTSTSGEISEVEDFPAFEATVSRPGLVNTRYGSDFDTSDFGDIEAYRLSTASSCIGLPTQAHMLANSDIGALDMDAFLKADGYTGGSNHGQLAATYDETKDVQDTIDFDETSFLPLSAEEESDSFWTNEYESNISMTQSRSEPRVELIWASQ